MLIFLLFVLLVVVPISIIILVIFLNSNHKVAQRIPYSYRVPQRIYYMDKGKQGEYLVYKEIVGIQQGERILNNLYIPIESNKTVEIDLILINSSGIYILESKNYNGWIYGNEVDKYWTQNFSKSNNVQFYNPIWQNRGHLKAVMNVLGLSDYNLYKSIIVFGNNCEIKDVKWHTLNVSIVQRYELRNKIISYMSNSIFTTEQIDKIYYSLLEFTYINKDTIANHQAQVNRMKDIT